MSLIGTTQSDFDASIMQELLRTLTFVNQAVEPSLIPRSIMVSISSSDDTQSCPILVSISPVNDNAPEVDLSGPLDPSINHTVLLNYTFLGGPASEWISARDASVIDQDIDGQIESLTVELLPGQPGDRIFMSEELGCSLDDTSVCLLR